MEKKYMAAIFNKIKISEDTYIFRNMGTATNAVINFKDDFNELTCYDNNNNKLRFEAIQFPEVIISDEKVCYGYPIEMDLLKSKYPECKSDEALVTIYEKMLENNILIAFYSEQNDNTRIYVTTKDDLAKGFDKSENFKGFTLAYDSDWNVQLGLNLSDVKKIIQYIDEGNTEQLNESFIKLKELIEEKYNDKIKKYESYGKYNQKKEEIEKEKKLIQSLSKLKKLTGLDNVKEIVDVLLKYLVFKDKVKDELTLDKLSLNMVFTGNPGTGKTTVARIISELLYEMGYIKNNKVAEITPKELIAGYVGQTALKTAKFIEQHKGSVIFIDEAYVFDSDKQLYAQEALAEVLKELEKNETIFIFAGYKKEMENFINMNSGLQSRIGLYFEFKDYTIEELYQIFENKVNDIGFTISSELKDSVLKNLEEAKSNEHFGNGRYIDKLINKIILTHAKNTEKISDINVLKILEAGDLNNSLEDVLVFDSKSKIRNIGFKK